jgi:putative ATPase
MPTIRKQPNSTPLAAILRPSKLSEIIGQDHLLGPGKPLSQMAAKHKFTSTIFWGPPGTGKTSIVRALALETNSVFEQLNATDATVKDIRAIIAGARERSEATFVFVDEIHRWTKAQQDVVLPVVEDGTIILFGATTEKPKFAVNSTILSRCLVLEVKPLDAQAMINLIKRVKEHYKAKGRPVKIEPEAAKRLITRSSGDARKAITALETCIEILSDDGVVAVEHIDTAIPDKHIVFDRSGNEHFDLAHCYQEAIQHSDVNGALYWLGKWITSGEDPAYICRRMLITAFEDCAGNPFAWLAAMAASYATERTGLPECMIPMALATAEMGTSRRNKSAYHAIKKVMEDIEKREIVHVPPELRAGTAGYTRAVNKRYLEGFKKDVPALDVVLAAMGQDKREGLDGLTHYAIGEKQGENSYGMHHGPTPSLDEMLQVVGSENDYIIEFTPDGEDHPIYRWNAMEEGGEWASVTSFRR